MGRVISRVFKQITSEGRNIDDLDRQQAKKVSQVYSLINFEPSGKIGKIRPSKGISLIGQVDARKPIQNLKFSKNNAGTTKLTAIANGIIYDITGWSSTATITQIATGLHSTNFVDIVSCTKKDIGAGTIDNFLVLLDGDNYPQKYDYSTKSNLTTNHKASFGLFVGERLHTNDITEKALWRYSKAYEPDDFTTADNAGFKQIGDNSNPLTAATNIFIPADNSSHIILAKEDQIWAISGNTPSSFAQYQINKTVGTKSPRGLIEVNQDLLILDKADIHRYSTLGSQGLLNQKKISDRIRDIYKESVNTSYLNNAFLFYDIYDNNAGRIYCFFPTKTSNINEAMVYDRNDGWFRRYFNNYYFTCADKDPDTGIAYAGDIFGNIWQLNTGYKYNNDNYRCFIDFGFLDFGVSVVKTGTPNNYLEIEAKEDANVNLNILMLGKEGGFYGQQEKTLSFIRKKYQYGSAKYGHALYSESTRIRKEFETGIFNKLKIQLSMDAAKDIEFNELYLEAESGLT